MPTVLRQRGFDVAVRPRDHGPPHVHILHSGEEVVILLGVGRNCSAGTGKSGNAATKRPQSYGHRNCKQRNVFERVAKNIRMKTTTKYYVSDAELDRQIHEAEKRGITEPEAKSARYKSGKVRVELASGWNFAFDPKTFSEFKNATETELKQIGLWGRYTLGCPPLDIHIGIGSIIFELIGDKVMGAQIGRRYGSATSEKKKAASQANGKLGGRPKKTNKSPGNKPK